jgi:hypothetical protein
MTNLLRGPLELVILLSMLPSIISKVIARLVNMLILLHCMSFRLEHLPAVLKIGDRLAMRALETCHIALQARIKLSRNACLDCQHIGFVVVGILCSPASTNCLKDRQQIHIENAQNMSYYFTSTSKLWRNACQACHIPDAFSSFSFPPRHPPTAIKIDGKHTLSNS